MSKPSNDYFYIFNEIVSIVRNDYAGHVEKRGWDQPDYFRSQLQYLSDSGKLDSESFFELVNTYLLDVQDKHLLLLKTGEKRPPRTPGFTVRRYQNQLIVTNVSQEKRLEPGMKITALDGSDILTVAQDKQKMLRAEQAERENWMNVLSESRVCTVEHFDKSFELTLNTYAAQTPKSEYVFKMISSDIAYLRFTDCLDVQRISNLIRENQKVLDQSRGLIVDIRLNRGGNDAAFADLLPYVFPLDTSLNIDGALHYVTERNWRNRNKQIQKLLDSAHHPEERAVLELYLKEVRAIIDRGFQEISLGTTQEVSIQGRELPRHVVLLIDSFCASSGEQFALMAADSPKVQLMGRPTAGALDFANVTYEEFEEINMALMYPTSKSVRILRGKGIDNLGVQPHVYTPWTPQHLEKDIDLDTAIHWLRQKNS